MTTATVADQVERLLDYWRYRAPLWELEEQHDRLMHSMPLLNVQLRSSEEGSDVRAAIEREIEMTLTMIAVLMAAIGHVRMHGTGKSGAATP